MSTGFAIALARIGETGAWLGISGNTMDPGDRLTSQFVGAAGRANWPTLSELRLAIADEQGEPHTLQVSQSLFA